MAGQLAISKFASGRATDPLLSKITRKTQVLVLVSLGKVPAGVDEVELLASFWLGGIARDESSGGCECVFISESAYLLLVN